MHAASQLISTLVRGQQMTETPSYMKDPQDMLGILVNGDNHFIVRGPLPGRNTALALVKHWSLIRIGTLTPPHLVQWQIVSRAFRENLEWAVIVPGDSEIGPAVATLLEEMSARGIAIQNSQRDVW